MSALWLKMESCNCLVNSVEVPSVSIWICLGFKYLDTLISRLALVWVRYLQGLDRDPDILPRGGPALH